MSCDDVDVEIHNIPFAQRQNAVRIILELISSAEEEVAVVIGVSHCQ
jgi:hypothetical protein